MNERVGRWGQVRIYTGKFYRIFLHEKGWKFIAFAVIIAVLLSVVMGDKMFVEKEFTRTGMFAIVTAMIWVGVFNSIQNTFLSILTHLGPIFTHFSPIKMSLLPI